MSRAVVAMSGGVDSSVAAYLLAKAGENIIGVSMQVWDYRGHNECNSKSTCCAPDDFTDARMVASAIGIPYYVFDLEDIFREKVINNFVNSYYSGITPNPCIDCNSKVKFAELRDRALKMGCAYVATGHYAQIKEVNGGLRLCRGVDRDKDQSYFLYDLKQEELKSTLFPVGHLTKSQVRKIAKDINLVTAAKPESQDICFVSGKVQDFIAKIGKKKKVPDQHSGIIQDTGGKMVGTHSGVHNYTVGQRRGLGLSGSKEPLYVVRIDADKQVVTVGGKSDLKRESFCVGSVNWLESYKIGESFESVVQVRSRHRSSSAKDDFGDNATVSVIDHNKVEITFHNCFSDDYSSNTIALNQAIVPGQAAVFYDTSNEYILGGGRIL